MIDGAQLLRMALFCAVIHESGHVLCYCVCTRHLPRLTLRAGGVSLAGAEELSSSQELAVVASGPLFNFFIAAVLLYAAQQEAHYVLYFLAAVNLCTGLYNLLPIGVLDGARLLSLLLPPACESKLYEVQRIFLALFLCVGIALAVFCDMPASARVAALIAPCYLFCAQRLS